MKISVVIPVYNAADTVERAIDSVLHQTVPVAEIILIDDGSTDRTAQTVQKYGSAIRYFHYENAGLPVARNRGIDQAQSEWIAFLDADDEWLPHCVESHAKLHALNPGIKWSYCSHKNVVDGVRLPMILPPDLQDNGLVSYFEGERSGLRCGVCGFVVHRSVFDEVGNFDPSMRTGQDGDMWCRIGLKYPKLAVCRRVCWLYYRGNPHSLHRKGIAQRDLQLKSLCANMRRAMKVDSETRKEFCSYARPKVVEYLVRAAGRDCFISSDAIADAKSLFPLTAREHALLRMLRVLPKPIAVRVVRRLVP